VWTFSLATTGCHIVDCFGVWESKGVVVAIAIVTIIRSRVSIAVIGLVAASTGSELGHFIADSSNNAD